MSKHTHHQTNKVQISNSVVTPLNYDPHQAALQDSSVQLLAYQIHLKRGGSDLDNWLEAENLIKNDPKGTEA